MLVTKKIPEYIPCCCNSIQSILIESTHLCVYFVLENKISAKAFKCILSNLYDASVAHSKRRITILRRSLLRRYPACKNLEIHRPMHGDNTHLSTGKIFTEENRIRSDKKFFCSLPRTTSFEFDCTRIKSKNSLWVGERYRILTGIFPPLCLANIPGNSALTLYSALGP